MAWAPGRKDPRRGGTGPEVDPVRKNAQQDLPAAEQRRQQEPERRDARPDVVLPKPNSMTWVGHDDGMHVFIVKNAPRHCRGVAGVELDGSPTHLAAIPLEDDGRVHRVRVVLGAGRDAPSGAQPPATEASATTL